MDAVIFDVDGTLWDSTSQVAIAWNQVLKEEKIDKVLSGDELKKLFGLPMYEIMERIFPEKDRETRDAIADKLFMRENQYVSQTPCYNYPRMEETIASLSKEYQLFIVSNCQTGYIEAFLENTGLGDCFIDYTCPGDTGMLKADNIKYILGRYGLSKAVYVGDTRGDELACKEAGIPMIFAQFGFGEVEEKHVSIQNFSELPEVLREMDLCLVTL